MLNAQRVRQHADNCKALKSMGLWKTDAQLLPVQSHSSKVTAALADMIYANNLPFSTVEDAKFREFVVTLNPGFKPPSRKQVASNLFDASFSTARDKMTQKVPVCLQFFHMSFHICS